MKRIGVIFGGQSSEHDVSLLSAASVIKALREKKEYEIVMLAISKSGMWYRYEGSEENIADKSWPQNAYPFDIGQLKSTIDFALPILHGAYGEDGTIQGLFEMLGIPYGGCGVLASAVCMDKLMARAAFEKAGIPGCRYMYVTAYKLASSVLYRSIIFG